ncbi:MAG TPA: FAD-dependent oxidoreductase [Thermohalobaculum sp.]|nr:FAD-dependent oxidoreductase [Thermohalobaculum sp.]
MADGTANRRDPRFDILFEPVRIGPKVAKNRFYQVPHCNGMGYRDPAALAEMRGVKAEGGWAVVCTEEVEIHPSGDITPYIEGRIWDDSDIPALALQAEKIHEHGALAGIELCHNGLDAPNLYSREVPLAPSALPIATFSYHPIQARAMDKADIRELRRWHRDAAIRGRRADFDLIYVYAGHGLSIFSHFLSRRLNHRTDEYGGSLENRLRLMREVLEETKEAVGDTCAVPIRMAMSELSDPGGLDLAEAEDIIGLIGEIPDLWDLCLAGWKHDSVTSRFGEEGGQEKFLQNVKKLTTKPVVGVGRYTSPDRMVSLVRGGVLDLIGAARPSIADPFLPRKLEEGRLDDIRECIGCNICVTGDFTMSPIRCTQNPSMGDEWRRGWHPERIRASESDKPVLIVGAGPAGLEAAQMLGKRGYRVTLAEAGTELGGRVLRESRLPGLAAWIRVRDHRKLQLDQLPNVEVYLDSDLDAGGILEFGFPRVVLATGATWRADGVAHRWTTPMPIAEGAEVLTPDDLMAGRRPKGRRVLIWDDDHAYMGGVLAELLAGEGLDVGYACAATEVSAWTKATMEQPFIQARLIEMEVRLHLTRNLEAVAPGVATLACTYTGRLEEVAAEAVVLVTSRLPNDRLTRDLAARRADWSRAGIESVTAIGDALAPATIAHAVHAGRRYAEELDAAAMGEGAVPFRREIVAVPPR